MSDRQSIGRVIRGASPEIRKLLRIAHDQNFTVTKMGSQHYRVVAPRKGSGRQTSGVSVLAGTPSSSYSVPNSRAALQRIGVKLGQHGDKKAKKRETMEEESEWTAK